MEHSHLIQGGEIVLSGYVLDAEMLEWWGSGGFCAGQVRAALSEIGGDVTIRLNSYGGVATEGEAIRAAIAGHEGTTSLVVEGIAASAASLLALGADERSMSDGSLWMIHDPSTGLYGTEDDLRREADVLGKIADTYAAVYAQTMRISQEEVRDLMRAETWFDAAEASAAGLVTASDAEVSDTDESKSAARADFPRRMQEMARRIAERKQAGAPAATTKQESSMSDTPTPAAGPGTHPAAPSPAPQMQQAPGAVPTPEPEAPAADAAAIREAAVAEERQRGREITAAAAPFLTAGQIEQSFVSDLIESGATASAASQRLLSHLAEQQGHAPTGGARARIVRDEGETQVAGMVSAMCGETDGPAESYRGMRSLRQLALTLSGDVGGYTENRSIRAGMGSTAIMSGAHGLSDFAYITTEVVNVRLMNAYRERAATWRAVAGEPIPAADFREIHAARFGGDFTLRPVQESGEYEAATLSDEAEGLRVERRGRSIAITFEAVVNDQVGAFDRLPGEFAREARRMENSMVWALVRSNAKLKSDGKALFHADHKNLATAAGTIAPGTVGAARKLMWEQKAYGAKDSEAFLEIDPDTLIVPPALEEVARQFVMPVAPTEDGQVNPFKSLIRDVVIVPNLGAAVSGGSDSAWYLVASDLPPIAVAYLDGYEAPTIVSTDGLNPDLMKIDARHIFGAAPAEFRGAYKNAGL